MFKQELTKVKINLTLVIAIPPFAKGAEKQSFIKKIASSPALREGLGPRNDGVRNSSFKI